MTSKVGPRELALRAQREAATGKRSAPQGGWPSREPAAITQAISASKVPPRAKKRKARR